MKRKILILILIAVLFLATIACIGSGEVNREASSQAVSSNATATSAAQEFHVQLTLTAPTPIAISP